MPLLTRSLWWKYGSSRINAYSVVSRSVKDTLAQGGVDAKKIHVVYSALSPDRFSKLPFPIQTRKSLSIPDGVKVIGKLANYSRWKGHHVYIQAAKICLKENPNLRFLLIGKDTEKLGAEIQQLGVGHAVKILGFRRDVPEILSALDVSVNAAIEGEGLSGAMRESLMLGIPVVASDVSGNSEIVRNDETGFLVAANNAAALALGISRALTEPAGAKAMAQKGKQWVLDNATVDKMATDTLKLYEGLL